MESSAALIVLRGTAGSRPSDPGGCLFGRVEPSQLPEPERLAFVGALCAMAACDGAASLEETLEVLARIDLRGLTAAGVRRACEHVLAPPSLEACVASLAALPAATREEVATELLSVARVDRAIVPAEVEALATAQRGLGLDDRALARAARRVAHEEWEREHGMARADALDHLRNAVVLAGGFGAPVAAIVWLGSARAPDPRLAIAAGVDALGMGYGFAAGIAVSMAISVLGSSLTSALTLRGRRADRIRRDIRVRAERLRANLQQVVEHLGERLREVQFGDGPRAGSVALENRYLSLQQTLARLPQPPT